MASDRDHFVSRFYLKAFASAPKRINLYNLREGRAISDASLRDQCYERGLHDPIPGLEGGFAKLENDVAPVIRKVITTGQPPRRNSAEMAAMIVFVATQQQRSHAAIDAAKQSAAAMTHAALKFKPPHVPVPGGFGNLTRKQELQLAFAGFPQLPQAYVDLHARIILPPTGARFLTSDNPVVLHNHYCEGVCGSGTLGALQSGLQIFVPLAPSSLLMLFDHRVYKCIPREDDALVLSARDDFEILNALQVLNAEHNVYFSHAADIDAVSAMVGRFKALRVPQAMQVDQYERVDDPHDGRLHTYRRMLKVHLDLSFLSLRRNARRVELSERARSYRQNPAFPDARRHAPPITHEAVSFRPRPKTEDPH